MNLRNRLIARIVALWALIGPLGLSVSITGQTAELDRFVGTDFSKGGFSASDWADLKRIIGKVPKGLMMEPGPWHVWKASGNGPSRYIVLLVESEVLIPGGSSACVLLFDGASKRLNSWCFQTGWRMTPDNASLTFSNDLATDLIVLHMGRFINGRDVAKEYFALGNDRLRLVRMENEKGEAVQNEYVFPNYEIGIIPAGETEGEWANMLGSADKAEVLSALVFLGGRHVTEAERHFAPGPAESKYGGLFQQLLSSPRIRELIERLSHSDNEWVREEASLAMRGPRERSLR
jgi:hypothetical protein